MASIERIGDEDIVYQGKIIEVVNQKVNTQGKEQVFEYARRSPGTRLIIVSPENKILLTKEYRLETTNFDYRLPGGKVFDTLVEYNDFLRTGEDIIPKAQQAAMKEAVEEVGIDVEEIKHLTTSKVGSTVVWDLIYFVVAKYSHRQQGQELDGAGEDIEVIELTIDEAKEICLDGRMQEDRSVAVLLKYIHSLGK